MNISPHTWMVALLSGGHAHTDIDDASIAALVVAAGSEGVLPLLEWRLHDAPDWQRLPAALQDALARGARKAAAEYLFREAELRRVARVLERHEIKTLLLKGNALGLWLYPKPYLRVTRDIDLLMESRAATEQAASVVTELGYALEFSPAASNHEMNCRLVVDGVSRSELDLHSRLLNAAAYSDIFSFEELWSASVPLPTLGGRVRALGPMHALAHACLNRALDMQMGVPDQLKLQYDIQLLVGRMDADAWRQFLAMVASKRIGGICLRSINDTVATFGSPVPDHALEALRCGADAEPIDWRRLQDWRYMQWHNFKSLPGAWARVNWTLEKIFPTRSHLRALHGEGPWIQLMRRRLVRGIWHLRR